MIALAPSSLACWIISSNASLRVCSQRLLKSEIFPPTMVCSPAPIVPTIDRERTMIPRTTPRLRGTRYPGSSNAVVTAWCGTITSPLSPVDFDDRRVLHNNLFHHSIFFIAQPGAHGRCLSIAATLGHDPLFVQEQ